MNKYGLSLTEKEDDILMSLVFKESGSRSPIPRRWELIASIMNLQVSIRGINNRTYSAKIVCPQFYNRIKPRLERRAADQERGAHSLAPQALKEKLFRWSDEEDCLMIWSMSNCRPPAFSAG